MNHLPQLRVLVLGLGTSGLAMARWCASHGAQLRVWDSRTQAPQAEALRAEHPDVAVFSGDLTANDLADVQLVLKSPGLAPHDARIAPLLQAAAERGIAIGNELSLFIQALADLKAERRYAPKLLAVTGTNGKTTTTAMAALLVQRCGKRVAAAGNIGPTMLDTLAAALALEPVVVDADMTLEAPEAQAPAEAEVPLDIEPTIEITEAAGEPAVEVKASEGEGEALAAEDDAPLQLAPPPPQEPVFEHLPEVWVLELSSFQLDGIQGFEPSAAAVLNVTQDHLDWHGSMDAYAAAKARVFGEQTVMVINRDDLRVEAMVPAPVIVKGARGKRASVISRHVTRFGLDAPHGPGDFGLVTEGGMAWLVRALEADETIKRKKGEEVEIHLQRLMPADALRVRGRHNAANALAALALAVAIGCPLAPMLHGLREYHGEPHRVEFIATVGGVEAYDDGKGTNVGATVAALDGLGADKAPSKLIVILGGDGKGQDFAPLAAPVAHFARAVALIGRDADAIATVLADAGVPMQRHATLPDATRWCFEQAQAGDAVLLSPACASLDMFRNYGHRSEVFVETIRSLAADRGETV